MKNNIAATGLFCAALLSSTLASAAEKRGIYLDFGLGAAAVSYGNDVDDSLDLLEDNGFDRTTLSLDLSVGWAVRPNLFLVGSISGFADRLDDGDDDLQLNTYLTGVGVRYYPLSSMKHLQLGADVGIANMVLQSSEVDDETSDAGAGLKLSVAWDFDSTLKGPALLLGLQFMTASIEHETVTGGSLFARFLLK